MLQHLLFEDLKLCLQFVKLKVLGFELVLDTCDHLIHPFETELELKAFLLDVFQVSQRVGAATE